MVENAKRGLRQLTPEAVAEAKALLRGADHGAIAVIEPGSGWPLVSRVGLATLDDGSPLLLVSALAAHTPALLADPRCSLLVGRIGKGDALAHPRLSLICRAEPIPAGTPEAVNARARYLARHPKSALYVDLPDFRFLRLDLVRASFNAGFGRAYAIEGKQLLG